MKYHPAPIQRCVKCGRSNVFLIRFCEVWWCFNHAPVKMAE